MTPKSPKNAAFTLLEMNLVVVAIGLIIGGFFMGVEFKKNAQLQSVGADYQKYTTAIKNFLDKYDSLPGDMPDATTYWGDAGGVICTTTFAGTLNSTCNGNGDGQIGPGVSMELTNGVTAAESFRSWQHLGKSGFIEGNYNGQNASATNATIVAAVDSTVPASSFDPKIGWTLFYAYPFGNVIWPFRDYGSETGYDSYGNVLMLGSGLGLTTSPSDAHFIDRKFDDGNPYSGMIKILYHDYILGAGSFRCTGMTLGSNDPYTTSISKDCPLIWKTGY